MQNIFGQNNHIVLLSQDKKDIDVKRRIARSPGKLVTYLTHDKNDEKSKFDAIFSWVASNITYDYKTYYSSNGSGRTNFKKLLRRKEGICVDYASLMDTLCFIAGIQNVSVFGYAKDEIFDLHDSIYIDNHVWNAVKLNNSWYLYDATWASGTVDVRYKRFSRFLISAKAKFPVVYIQKKVKRKKRYVFIDECGKTISSGSFYYKQKLFNKVMRTLIGLFRLKAEYYYTKKINSDYYLTNPDLMAITHFPDNPDWSLLGKTTMRKFEMDSAYYHLDSLTYKQQNRQGVVCADCDNNLSMTEFNKNHHLRRKSMRFNSRNSAVVSLCEYNIGSINLKSSVGVSDSLSKISLLDSSIAYLQLSRQSLKSCFRNIDEEFILQKDKNRRKQMMLLGENNQHSAFMKEKINISFSQKRNLKTLLNKSNVNLRKYKRNRIKKLRTLDSVDKRNRLSESALLELTNNYNQKKIEVDSLSNIVNIYRTKFDSIVTGLSYNVWQKVVEHDSLILPILGSMKQRFLLKDNMKKSVVEVRKHLPIYEKNYSRDISHLVYTPARKLADFGIELFGLIDKRNHSENDLYQLKLLLIKYNAMPLSDLEKHRDFLKQENKNDYCWLNGMIPSMKATHAGFKSLKDKQLATLNMIVRENEVERARTHYINKELLRRKKKYRKIVTNNTIVSNVKLITVKREKRNYLNELKKERRKAAKKI